MVSPVVSKAETANFSLSDFANRQISLPEDEILYPHQIAIDWHRKNVFQS